MKLSITLVMLLFLAPSFPKLETKAEAKNPFGEIKEQCEWGGEYFNPGDSIRPDLWCVAVCDSTGEWWVTCD